ncbi:MAG: DegT/DnrJ/EryC1/StrS family aminotransferase [Candidatus Bathyarchaeia archaeon]
MHDIEMILKNGTLTLGPRTKELEEKFSEYMKMKNAVAVSSGASSLEISLRYFGIENKEVIVPTNTFVATPNSIVLSGGRPIFADMLEDTLCIDPADIRRKISPKTAGIVVVHIAGIVCPQIQEIKEICDEHGLFLIEDCAHAHGSKINGLMAGAIGDAGCFSFAPTKGMTTGEGGIIVTNNTELAESAYFMRNRGLNNDRLMVTLGQSWCMSEIDAVLGIHQLQNLEYFVEKRNALARQYESLLNETYGLSLFPVPSNIRHSYHKFPVRIANQYNVDKIACVLKENYGVETGRVYYPPCHMHPYYREHFSKNEETFPIAEKVSKQVLCLPIHLALSDREIEYIALSLKAILRL